MTYNKPEVSVVGAAEVIRMQLKPVTTGIEFTGYGLVPAYDLDD